MLSFLILLFILATCFEGDFESVTIDTWVIVLQYLYQPIYKYLDGFLPKKVVNKQKMI